MSPEQKEDLEEYQKEVDAELDNILTDEQKERLKAKSGGAALPGQNHVTVQTDPAQSDR